MPWEERTNKACDLVLQALAKNMVVLIHCKAGLQRSGTFGAVLLAIIEGMSWEQGMHEVMAKRMVYTDKHRKVVEKIGAKLELTNYVVEYTHRDEWDKLRTYFRSRDHDSDAEVPPRTCTHFRAYVRSPGVPAIGLHLCVALWSPRACGRNTGILEQGPPMRRTRPRQTMGGVPVSRCPDKLLLSLCSRRLPKMNIA